MKKVLAFGAVTLALAGCGGNKLNISSRVGARTPLALTAAGSSQLNVNGGVVVNDVKLIVRRIRLEPTAAPVGQSSAGEDEVGIGPFPLEFDVSALDNGTLVHNFTGNVAAGSYKQIKFEIHKVEDADIQGASAADAALLTEMKGLSVKITGVYLGTPFTFTSALDEEQEREGTFNVGGTGSSNITLNIDPINWFIDGSGGTLAPGDAANQSRIESNIKASIDAYEDDNEDGKPDTK